MSLAEHFVSDEEARNFVFSEIIKLVDLLSDNAITFQDYYYRVRNEPTLSVSEKRDLITSPTRETVFKLWKNTTPTFEINGIAIPSNSVVVVANKASVWTYVNKYPFLKPITAKPVPLGVMTALKAISSIVKGFRDTIVVPDLPWKHVDALATIVVMARLTGIKIISNMPILLLEEINSYEKYNPRVASLGDLSVTLVKVSTRNITRRFEPALLKLIEDNGLDEIARVYNINPSDLYWRDDWWNYLDFNNPVDEELLAKALSLGLPSNVARKIASWKVRSINDLVKLAREIRLMISDDKYFDRAIELLAETYNTRKELITELIYKEVIL